MSDNLNKYNKNTSSITHLTRADESVISLRPYNPASLWVFALLVFSLICTLAVFIFLSRSEPGGNNRSGPIASTPANLYSISLFRDIELIKGQMSLLITGAMESKIQQLERSLKSGIISPRDLATLQELKEDLKVLKAYTLQNASTTSDPRGDVDTIGGPVQAQASHYSDQLLQEISNIRNLFYIGIVSCGGLILIIGGLWLRGYYRFRQIQSERLFRHPKLDKPTTGYY